MDVDWHGGLSETCSCVCGDFEEQGYDSEGRWSVEMVVAK